MTTIRHRERAVNRATSYGTHPHGDAAAAITDWERDASTWTLRECLGINSRSVHGERRNLSVAITHEFYTFDLMEIRVISPSPKDEIAKQSNWTRSKARSFLLSHFWIRFFQTYFFVSSFFLNIVPQGSK